jgi:hypothetical protein
MSVEDQRALQANAEAGLMAQATTSPMPEEQPPIYGQNSGPVGSGGNAPEPRTPVGNGANESQPAGPDLLADKGTPEDRINKMAPGEVEEALEKSASHVANMAMDEEGALSDPDLEAARVQAKKRAVGEAMAGQGANPQTALEKERDKRLKQYKKMEEAGEITPVQHEKLRDKWKNIFNIVPKEDMGLVLMDFGFRAMMAGETMGSAGAIGAAGSGALAGIQSRRKEDYDRSVEQFNMADEGARGALAEGRQSNDTINTEKGVMEWKDGKWQYVKDDTGANVLPSTLAGRPSVKQWEIDQWQQFGMTPNDARLAAMSGVTPQQARDTALRLYMQEMDKFGRVQIPGKGQVRERDLTEADKNAYIESHIKSQGYGADSGGAGGGSGIGGGGGSDVITEKPPNWSDEEWQKYQEITG